MERDAPNSYHSRPWQENVLHIYPRTFNEGRPEGESHRGVGSLRGITEKLEWMKETGVTAVWLGPIYASPGLDGNYDVSDYYAINPELGTMRDAEELIAQAHEKNIRVMFDLVPNHTSNESEWFKASSDPTHEQHEIYKDYYIWRDPVPGELPEYIVAEDRLSGLPEGLTVPNNWSSIFSTPQIEKARKRGDADTEIPAVTAWVWNIQRQQFYLAEFMKEQPSLNWQNPAVREELKDVVRFWLDKGVDSFRVDVINHIGKDPNFSNEVLAPIGTAIGEYTPGETNPHDRWRQEKLVSHWPELGKYALELLSVTDEPAYKDKNIRFVFEDWMSALADDGRLDALRPKKQRSLILKCFLIQTVNTGRRHMPKLLLKNITLVLPSLKVRYLIR